MTNSIQDFFRDDPWDLIKEPCYPEGRRLYLKDERFWVSMDENREILFFVQDKGAGGIKPLENLSGLDVTIVDIGNGESRLICRLTSQEADLLEKFATVAKDIAFNCSGFQGQQLFLKTQERIKSWANFLRPSRTGLKHSEFVGFLGELYALAEHLMPVLPAADSVRAWIGPEGKKQDFTFNDFAIEVKTTLSGDQQAIRISSLDQLDKVTENLYLMRIIASPAAADSGFSLAELYGKCAEAVAHDVLQEGLFLQKASGLYGRASESQLLDRYAIANVSLFEVTESFPKLTRGNVDLAIRDASYDIAVAALSGHEITNKLGTILSNG